MKILPIGGTWSWKGELEDHSGEWWHPRNPFMKFLGDRGFEHVCPAEPFIWSTQVNGSLFWAKNHTDWQAGGAALCYYLGTSRYGPAEVPLEDRNIIAHSHAGQVVAYAAAFRGLHINNLVTIGSPVRHDMRPIYRAARPQIKFWLHIASDWSDRMQWFGEWFDGSVGVQRRQPFADVNDQLPGIGHSKILRDPEYFRCWDELGWLEMLQPQNKE